MRLGGNRFFKTPIKITSWFLVRVAIPKLDVKTVQDASFFDGMAVMNAILPPY